MKRKYIRNENKLRQTQGCLTDCVAYFFNLHPYNVPYFVYPREGWNERLKEFFKKHGYKAEWRVCFPETIPQRGTHIVCGNSIGWKTFGHVVVYKNGKMIYDPNFESKWKDKRITHRLKLTKIENKNI